jgi:hypothetical protein
MHIHSLFLLRVLGGGQYQSVRFNRMLVHIFCYSNDAPVSTPDTRIRDVKDYLVSRKYIPVDFWHRFQTIVTTPGRLKPVDNSSTLASLSLGPLSHIQFRVLLLGGVSNNGKSFFVPQEFFDLHFY